MVTEQRIYQVSDQNFRYQFNLGKGVLHIIVL